MKKTNKKTNKELLHRIKELESQLAHGYYFAGEALNKLDIAHLIGSGVLMQLFVNGESEAKVTIMIKDGLSIETIKAIKNDLIRSYENAIEMKPKQWS